MTNPAFCMFLGSLDLCITAQHVSSVHNKYCLVYLQVLIFIFRWITLIADTSTDKSIPMDLSGIMMKFAVNDRSLVVLQVENYLVMIYILIK